MSVFQPTKSEGWVSFSEDITDRLNEEKAWCFVCDEDAVRERYPSYTANQLNFAINSTFLMLNAILEGTSAEARRGAPSSSVIWTDPLDTGKCLGRILITAPAHCSTYFECTAVWGQPLLFSLIDMPVDASYVCDHRLVMKLVEYYLDNTPHTQHPSPQHQDSHLPLGLVPEPLVAAREGIIKFISEVMNGTCRRALQGRKPCPIHAPPSAMGLCTGLQGVSCTFRPLVYDPFCDTVTMVFSKRCPCCPDVLYMLDFVVRHINCNRVRFEHEPERDPYWSGTKCVYSETNSLEPTTTFPEDNAAATGSASAEGSPPQAAAAPIPDNSETHPALFSYTGGGLLLTRLRLVLLNIEENDLGPDDWPVDEELQIVPHIRIYPANIKRPELHPVTGRPLPGSPKSEVNPNPLLERVAECDHCGVQVPIFRPDGTAERDTRLVAPKQSHLFVGTNRTPESILKFILEHMALTKLDAEGEKRVLAQFKKIHEKRSRGSPEKEVEITSTKGPRHEGYGAAVDA